MTVGKILYLCAMDLLAQSAGLKRPLLTLSDQETLGSLPMDGDGKLFLAPYQKISENKASHSKPLRQLFLLRAAIVLKIKYI